MSNTELINAYFDNELNPSEKKMFEDRLARDSDLQQEYKFQEDIIEGIRNARRQALKARLDQVQVGGAATGGSSWSAGKIAGIISLAAIVGFGIYYFYPESEPVETSSPIVMEEENDMQEPETQSADITDASEEIVDEVAKDGETPTVAQSTQPTATTEEVEKAPEEEKAADKVMEESKNPVVAPSFEDPRERETDVDLPAGEISGKAVVASENLEISVDSESRKYDFHYTLNEDKLTLFGNFESDLYQILEFNTADMKAWFLSFNGDYYRLEPTNGKVEKLEKVTDNAVLTTLREASKD